MKVRPVTVRTIDLGYEQLFMFDGGPDTRVRVLHGGTWLTEEGASGDTFVPAGDQVALRGTGRALLEGLGATRVQIVDASGHNFWQRIGRRAQRALRRLRQSTERLHLGERPAVAPNS